MTCNGVSTNPTIETPQVTIVTNRKHTRHKRLAVILGPTGGALFVILLISVAAIFYVRKRKTEVSYTASK